MVVALHLEDHGQSSPMSITPAFSPGPWMTHGALSAGVQMDAQDSVGTMLVPHRREDAEFRECRHPADQLQDALVFIRLQAVLGDEFGVIWGSFLIVKATSLRVKCGVPPAEGSGRWNMLDSGLLCTAARPAASIR
jgi:hypothetical protein